MFPRSSVSKTGFVLCNSVGVIDSGYRGTVRCRFAPTGIEIKNFFRRPYKKGDRIAQLIPVELPFSSNNVEIIKGNGFKTTERGSCGFGSTGN
jgi:dUTP pyrophosphatase